VSFHDVEVPGTFIYCFESAWEDTGGENQCWRKVDESQSRCATRVGDSRLRRIVL